MSKADDMFKELGYKIGHTQWGGLRFYKDEDNEFVFDYARKSFFKCGKWDASCDNITMQELKAINEKCKELGWLDE